MLTFTKTFS